MRHPGALANLQRLHGGTQWSSELGNSASCSRVPAAQRARPPPTAPVGYAAAGAAVRSRQLQCKAGNCKGQTQNTLHSCMSCTAVVQTRRAPASQSRQRHHPSPPHNCAGALGCVAVLSHRGGDATLRCQGRTQGGQRAKAGPPGGGAEHSGTVGRERRVSRRAGVNQGGRRSGGGAALEAPLQGCLSGQRRGYGCCCGMLLLRWAGERRALQPRCRCPAHLASICARGVWGRRAA